MRSAVWVWTAAVLIHFLGIIALALIPRSKGGIDLLSQTPGDDMDAAPIVFSPGTEPIHSPIEAQGGISNVNHGATSAAAVPPGVLAPPATLGAGEIKLNARDAPSGPVQNAPAPFRPNRFTTGAVPSTNTALLRLRGRLDSIALSTAEEQAKIRGAREWAAGKQFAIRPSRIRIGGIELALQRQDTGDVFVSAAGRRAESNAYIRSFKDIDAQASRIEAKRTFQERVKMIRESERVRRDLMKGRR